MEPNDHPSVQSSDQHRATLGCGTLILIALIVIIFSGSKIEELREDLKEMKTDFESVESQLELLRTEIALQTLKIESLKEQLENE